MRKSKRNKRRNFKYPVVQYLIEKYSTINSHVANPVIDQTPGASLEFRHLIKGTSKELWTTSFANELGRVLNGIGTRMKTGTNPIRFRPKSTIPKHKKVTYGRIVSSLRPHKEEQYRTRLTVGGNLLDYEGDTSTPTSDLITTKIHLNSVISTKNAKFATTHIKKPLS